MSNTKYAEFSEQDERVFELVTELVGPLKDKQKVVANPVYLTIVESEKPIERDRWGEVRERFNESEDFWSGEDTCEECTEIMIEKASMEHEGRLYANPNEPFRAFSYMTYDPCFGDHVSCCMICQTCGAFIDCFVTASGQELDHWEGFDDEDFIFTGELGEYYAYQIYKIFEQPCCYEPEEGARLLALAKRILTINDISYE